MSAVFLLWKKEMKSYFASPLAYVLTALFLFVIGLIFFNLVVDFVNNTQKIALQLGRDISFTDSVLKRLFGNMNFLFIFIAPLLSMRLFAEEKKQQTIELLYTAPISSLQMVLGKYFAVLSIVLFMLLLTMIFPITLIPSGFDDFAVMGTSYFGVVLSVASFLAIGIFASSITENQIIAAVITIVVIVCFWLVAWFSHHTNNYLLAQLLRYASMIDHFDNFTRGIITLSDIVYHISFTGFTLYLTKLSLDSRNW